MTAKPPVRPGEVLAYVERVCAACGMPMRLVWRRDGRYRRLCDRCRR